MKVEGEKEIEKVRNVLIPSFHHPPSPSNIPLISQCHLLLTLCEGKKIRQDGVLMCDRHSIRYLHLTLALSPYRHGISWAIHSETTTSSALLRFEVQRKCQIA